VKAVFIVFLFASALPGCMCVPATEWNAVQSQNRALTEQNRIQSAEIEDLRAHNRNLADKVVAGEKQLAQERIGGESPDGFARRNRDAGR
jgi:hypothetical protein